MLASALAFAPSAASAETAAQLDLVVVTAKKPQRDPDPQPIRMGGFSTLSASPAGAPEFIAKGEPDPDKNNPRGPCDKGSSSPSTRHPVIIATGEKFLEETDFTDASRAGLSLQRLYRANTPSTEAMFGPNWRTGWLFPKLVASTQCSGPLKTPLSLELTERAKQSVQPTAALAAISPAFVAPADGRSTTSSTCYPVHITLTLPNGANYRFVNEGGRVYVPSNLGPDSTVGWLDVRGFTASHEWVVTIADTVYAYHAITKQLKYIAAAKGAELLQAFEYDTAGKLTKVTGASGANIRFNYTGNRVTSVIDSVGRTWAYGYNAAGHLSSVTPPSGTAGAKVYHYESPHGADLLTGYSTDGVRNTRYAYDSSRRATRSGSDNGEEVDNFSYAGSTTTLTDQRGQPTTYNFSGSTYKRLVSVDRAATSTCATAIREQSYDSRGFVTSSTDWRNTTTATTYDSSGQPTQRILASGTSSALRTDYTWVAGNLTAADEFTSNGQLFRRTTRTYHSSGLANGKLASETVSDAGGSVQRVRTFAYTFHANGVLASVSETLNLPTGNVSRSQAFNTAGCLTGQTNEAGHTVSYAGHNAQCHPASVTDANGVVTQLAWDAAGRLTGSTQLLAGGNRSRSLAYNGLGLLSSVTEVGVSTQFARNSAGRVTGVGYAGASTTEALDVANRTETSTAPRLLPAGATTGAPSSTAASAFSRTVVRDSLGRPYTAFGGNGQRSDMRYDFNGNLLTQDDVNGRRVSFSYDALDRPRTRTEPGLGTITTTYDLSGRLDTVTDGRGLVTDYNFDALGNLVRLASPDTGVRTQVPDRWGRITALTRNDGSSISQSWDALDRLTSRASGGVTETFGYDAGAFGKGRLTSLSDASGSSSYSYNGAGQLTQQVNTIQGQSFTTGWGYNAAGFLSSLSYPVGALSLSYGYDSFGRISSVVATLNGSTITLADSFVYQPGSSIPLAWRLGSNLQRRLVQDASGRLIQISSPGAQDLTVAWNPNDTVASLGNTTTPSQSATIGYDAALRVSSYSGNGTAANPNLAYGYDAVGNRVSGVENGATVTPTVSLGSSRITALSGPQWRNLPHNVLGAREGARGAARGSFAQREVKNLQPTSDGQARSYPKTPPLAFRSSV
ncbi:MAG: RHS repeat protein [Burkholderiales bacterium]|nr:RHS repeat protein [Burkholderiales bacterium]